MGICVCRYCTTSCIMMAGGNKDSGKMGHYPMLAFKFEIFIKYINILFL